jgi:hypothetical protein
VGQADLVDECGNVGTSARQLVEQAEVLRSRPVRMEPRLLDERTHAHARFTGIRVRRESIDDDAALVGLEQAEQHAHGGRLAGPVVTDEAVAVPRFDHEGDIIENLLLPESVGDALQP